MMQRRHISRVSARLVAVSAMSLSLWLVGCAGSTPVAMNESPPAAGTAATVAAAASDLAVDVVPEAREAQAGRTATPEQLVLAARYGQRERVGDLLDQGVDINARDVYGNTPLIAAAGNRQGDIVRLLLERGADATATNHDLQSALMAAAASGDMASVQALLAAGAKVDQLDAQGETALFRAVQYGHRAVAKVLLDAGAAPDLRNSLGITSPRSGYTPLMYAAASGLTKSEVDWADMARLLIDHGADIAARNRRGESVLDCAIQNRNQAVIQVLRRDTVLRVDNVAELRDTKAGETETPEQLVLAARYGQRDLVGYLLTRGLDINARDAYGNTPLIAAASNRQRAIVGLLLQRGADIAATNHATQSALMAAAAVGDVASVRALLAAGAKTDQTDNQGETALFRAVQYGHAAVAKVLLEAGASADLRNSVSVNSPRSGYTPLMYVANGGLTRAEVDWPAMARLLLDHGANPNIKSSHGESALDFAVQNRNQAVVQVLRQGGAADEMPYVALSDEDTMVKAARLGDINKIRQLAEAGVSVNVSDGNGVTPLLAAAFEGRLEAVGRLVELGAEVNFVPAGLRPFAMAGSRAPLADRDLMEAASRGDTALLAAGRQGHRAIVEYLLEHGAQPALANRRGENLLLVAVTEGDAELTQLLLRKGADPNSLEPELRPRRSSAAGRNSVLIRAVQAGRREVTDVLLRAGANPNLRGQAGKTALYAAVESGRTDLAEMLIAAGANVNTAAQSGTTPLMQAARIGNADLVRLLLARHADVNVIEAAEYGFAGQAGDEGMTALIFAARGGHAAVVQALLAAGAEVNVHNAAGRSAIQEAAANQHLDVVRLLRAAGSRDEVALSEIQQN